MRGKEGGKEGGTCREKESKERGERGEETLVYTLIIILPVCSN